MHKTRKLVAGAMLAVAMPLAAGAQDVRFVGSTTGCFGLGCDPTLATTTDATGFFRFDSRAFDVETLFGSASVGGSGDNLAAFTFLGSQLNAGSLVNFGSQSFTLRVSLTPPGASTVPSSFDFTGTVAGGFDGSQPTAGGPRITFGGLLTRDFSFEEGGMTGTGTFSVQNLVSISPNGFVNQSTNMDGTITADVATVPEPSTYALMGTGLVGLLVSARRRRSA